MAHIIYEEQIIHGHFDKGRMKIREVARPIVYRSGNTLRAINDSGPKQFNGKLQVAVLDESCRTITWSYSDEKSKWLNEPWGITIRWRKRESEDMALYLDQLKELQNQITGRDQDKDTKAQEPAHVAPDDSATAPDIDMPQATQPDKNRRHPAIPEAQWQAMQELHKKTD